MEITGLILAGGRGSRMGSIDKGLVPLGGKAMVQHVMARLRPQVQRLLVNANQNLDAYAAFGAPVWPDAMPDFAGPLAGLQTGLMHCETPYLVTAPCDSPFLPNDLVQRLSKALLADGADLAVAVTGEGANRQPHPVFSLVHVSLLPHLTAFLEGGGRRVDRWYASLRVAEVHFADEAAFRNINTLAELQQHAASGGTASVGVQSPTATPTSSAPATVGAPGFAEANFHAVAKAPVLAESPFFRSMPRPTLTDFVSAIADYDPNALPVAQAQRIVQDFVQPIQGLETVTIWQALDRVLAADVISPISVPAHDNSAMDGFAFQGADLLPNAATTLMVIGTAYAGRSFDGAVGRGQCVRIMTGAVMPAGCDTVVPQEFTQNASDTAVTIPAGVVGSGDNRRLKGEDLQMGKAALHQGRRLRPADLGLLASLGMAQVGVRRRLRVAFFSTGDELRSLGEPLDAGCIYDSNRYTLFGMLTRLGCELIDMGVVPDNPAALEAALRAACAQADAIITSGGVSVGAADYTRQIMAQLGDVGFWKIGMRPGRPMAFGTVSSAGKTAYLFGLPGNPVAVMVTFYFFAREALLRMMGASSAPLPLLRATSTGDIRKKPGRTEYQRGILSNDAAGQPSVHITGTQGSGVLRSMSEANCMVVLHREQGNVRAGDAVDVVLFEGLI